MIDVANADGLVVITGAYTPSEIINAYECKADINGDQVTVTGHTCPKGEEYAINECLHPVRTVTATVRVANRKDTMVSVKTETPVPKSQIMAVMEALRCIMVDAPLQIGDVILTDICGSDICVTKEVN